jgi:hypothetical protein
MAPVREEPPFADWRAIAFDHVLTAQCAPTASRVGYAWTAEEPRRHGGRNVGVGESINAPALMTGSPTHRNVH